MQSLSSFRKLSSIKSMGIEWEMCLPDEKAALRYNFHGFFYCTDDGSVQANWDQISAEFVSQPLTEAWLIKELSRLNKKLQGFETNHSCGIHIHVNRGWCNPLRTQKIWEFLSELVAEEYRMAFGRLPNNYCTQILPGDLMNSGYRERYRAINITNDKTIEFRMFRSGDVKWAQYCVKLVAYMVENAKHLNADAFWAFVDANKPV